MSNLVESKVQSVAENGTFDSNYGTLYKYKYTMEDGTVLVANHKTPSPMNLGEEVSYEITKENQYGKMGKVKKGWNQEQYGNQGGAGQAVPQQAQRQAAPAPVQSGSKNASFALAYAKDLVVPIADKFSSSDEVADQTMRMAERFLIWLNNK